MLASKAPQGEMDRVAPGGISSGKGAILDAKIWKKLPEELLEKVLLYVPFHSLARFRCVCKKWNKYVVEDTFKGLREQVSPQKPWIVMTSTSDSLFAYDTGKYDYFFFLHIPGAP